MPRAKKSILPVQLTGKQLEHLVEAAASRNLTPQALVAQIVEVWLLDQRKYNR